MIKFKNTVKVGQKRYFPERGKWLVVLAVKPGRKGVRETAYVMGDVDTLCEVETIGRRRLLAISSLSRCGWAD